MKKTPLPSPHSKPDDLASLWSGTSVPLLQSLHILTREGKLNADSRRKLKQVRHLIQLIEPVLEPSYARGEQPDVIDLGAGKSYLGFLLYDLVLNRRGGSVTSIESRAELIEKTQKLALDSGFDRMHFVAGSIESAAETAQVHLPESHPTLVTALHACDTATDDAIAFALSKKAKAIALVPCCQAELARALSKLKADQLHPGLASLWAEGMHAREFGSHLTNVLRVLYLKSKGYKVRVTELVGWEHSMKNELILAEKVADDYPEGRKKLAEVLAWFPKDWVQGLRLFRSEPA